MLSADDLRTHCLAQKGAFEDFPFGEDVRVMKVMGKVFALIPVSGEVSISLKCDPELARMLRETYPSVTPGYHLNKRHWNTVVIDGHVPDDEILEMIEHSYDLVVKKLNKAQREELSQMS